MIENRTIFFVVGFDCSSCNTIFLEISKDRSFKETSEISLSIKKGILNLYPVGGCQDLPFSLNMIGQYCGTAASHKIFFATRATLITYNPNYYSHLQKYHSFF